MKCLHTAAVVSSKGQLLASARTHRTSPLPYALTQGEQSDDLSSHDTQVVPSYFNCIGFGFTPETLPTSPSA